VLLDLAGDFPAVAALVDQRPGGQRRLPAAGGGLDVSSEAPAGSADGTTTSPDAGTPDTTEGGTGLEPEELAPETAQEATIEPSAPARGARKPTRYGLRIEFEDDAESGDLGRLVESTVWVNAAHPAYKRAVVSRAEGYHAAVTVAMALAPLAAEPASVPRFVTAFLAAWGEALGRDKRRRQDRRGRRRRRPAAG
jgi:hypothetical protein